MATTTAPTAQTNGSSPQTLDVSIPSRRVTPEMVRALSGRVTVGDGSREWLDVEQPFTATPLGSVPRCAPADVEVAVERARETQRRWATSSFAERRQILLRFHDLVLERREEILDLIQLETGKA